MRIKGDTYLPQSHLLYFIYALSTLLGTENIKIYFFPQEAHRRKNYKKTFDNMV